MTDEDVRSLQLIAMFTLGALIGLIIGAATTDIRINSEIRTDQIELKKDVAEIIEDETIIEDIVRTLLFQIKQLKIERQELRELRLKLSDGE